MQTFKYKRLFKTNALVSICESVLLLDALVTTRPPDQKIVLDSDGTHIMTFNAM